MPIIKALLDFPALFWILFAVIIEVIASIAAELARGYGKRKFPKYKAVSANSGSTRKVTKMAMDVLYSVLGKVDASEMHMHDNTMEMLRRMQVYGLISS